MCQRELENGVSLFASTSCLLVKSCVPLMLLRVTEEPGCSLNLLTLVGNSLRESKYDNSDWRLQGKAHHKTKPFYCDKWEWPLKRQKYSLLTFPRIIASLKSEALMLNFLSFCSPATKELTLHPRGARVWRTLLPQHPLNDACGIWVSSHTLSMSWLSKCWGCKFYFPPLDAGGQNSREEVMKGEGRVKELQDMRWY